MIIAYHYNKLLSSLSFWGNCFDGDDDDGDDDDNDDCYLLFKDHVEHAIGAVCLEKLDYVCVF